MTVYEVTGTLGFRGYEPGDQFEAELKTDAELRAIRRGNIRIVSRNRTSLQPGSYRLPRGWDNPTPAKEG